MEKDNQRKEIAVKMGKMIYEHRNKKKYTQEFIAELFDISVLTIRSLEQGTVECNWVLLVQLCVLFEIDINQFGKENFLDAINERLDNFCCC